MKITEITENINFYDRFGHDTGAQTRPYTVEVRDRETGGKKLISIQAVSAADARERARDRGYRVVRVVSQDDQGVAEGSSKQPRWGYHIVDQETGNSVPNTPKFKTRQEAQQYLKTHLASRRSELEVDEFQMKEGVSEGHADQQRTIVKRNGQPVGEIGIDRESSPGVGQYYMKHYASGTDNSGYDSREEALGDLRHIMKQSVYGELQGQGVRK